MFFMNYHFQLAQINIDVNSIEFSNSDNFLY